MNITPELRNAINAYRAGDVNTYNFIYESSKNYIFNCIYKVVCNQNNGYEAACEIFNDTFMEISTSLYQLQDVEKYYSWAGTIATRKCFDYLKKNNYYTMETELTEDFPDDDNIIPETIMQNREKQMLVKQIIDTRLTEMEKLCVILYYYNDMKQADIAKALGIPENTVKTHLYRAKQKIKNAVLETEQTDGIRLYSFAPFMLAVLGLEMETMGMAAAAQTGVAMSSGMAGAENVTGNMGATPAEAMPNGMGAAPVKAAGMAAKTKVAIAAISILCVGAIVGIVALATRDKDDEKDKKRTEATTSYVETTEEPVTEQTTTEAATQTTEATTEEVVASVTYYNEFEEKDREYLYSNEYNMVDALNSDYLGDIYDYKFIFDGVELAVPMDYVEFRDKLMANGWDFQKGYKLPVSHTTYGYRPYSYNVFLQKENPANGHRETCTLHVTRRDLTPDMQDENGEITYSCEDEEMLSVVGFETSQLAEEGCITFFVTNEIGIGRSMSNITDVCEPFYCDFAYNMFCSDVYGNSAKYVEMHSSEDTRYFIGYGERRDALYDDLPWEIPFCSRNIFFISKKSAMDQGLVIDTIVIYNNPYLTEFDGIDM